MISQKSSSSTLEAPAPARLVSDERRRLPPLVRYIALRLGVSVLLIFGVTLVTFTLTNLVPADPAQAALGERAASDPAVVAEFRKAQGLDKPVVVQYFVYLGHLLQGNLGVSTQTHNPVSQDLSVAFPATAELAIFVIVFSIFIGIGLGLYAALRHNRFTDQLIRIFSLGGISIPTFWLALAVFYIFFYQLHWAPGSGRLDPAAQAPPTVTGMYTVDALLAGQWDTFVDALSHLALPGLVLTLYTVGLLIRFARSAVLDVLGQDYVTRRARQGPDLPAGRLRLHAARRAPADPDHRRSRLRFAPVRHRAHRAGLLVGRDRAVRLQGRNDPRPARGHGRRPDRRHGLHHHQLRHRRDLRCGRPESEGPVTATLDIAVKRKRPILPAVWRRPMAVIGVVVIAIWLIIAIFAPLIAPYDPLAQSFARLSPAERGTLVRHRRGRARRALAHPLRGARLASARAHPRGVVA